LKFAPDMPGAVFPGAVSRNTLHGLLFTEITSGETAGLAGLFD
jgi:hypothetical protein